MAKVAHWNLPHELTSADTAAAAALLKEYFEKERKDRSPWFSGSKFETFAGGGDKPAIANVVTAEDVLAVSLLSVHVPGDAVLKLLGSSAAELSTHLAMIPTNLELRDADDSHIGRQSAADKLWTAVRAAGVGPVTTSKLLARKRPNLLPVKDSVVTAVLGHPRSVSFWRTLREHLNAEDGLLHSHLEAARKAAGLDEQVSVIRCFDVAVWMIGKRDGKGVGRGRY